MAMCLSDGLRLWLGKGKVIKMKTMKRILPVIVLSMLMVLAIGMMSAAYAEPIEDYEMAIKSVKAVDGGYKVTGTRPILK